MGHVNLAILTPGHAVEAAYVKSLVRTLDALRAEGISTSFHMGTASHVALARADTLELALEEHGDEYDKLLWIDSDIAWDPADALRLFRSEAKIIGGAYISANGFAVAGASWLRPGRMLVEDVTARDAPFEVEYLGFGFVCIARGVFESIELPHFQIDSKGPAITGEDVAFCEKARAAGYTVLLDPLVRVRHHKQIELDWPPRR